MNRRIAVIISTYNGEKYIREQLESILNQKMISVELEVFIRDDGSTDDTCKILQEYSEKHINIHAFYENNIGYVGSFLRMLFVLKHKFLKFDYYSFSDQDDVWDVDKLQAGINQINNVFIECPILYQSVSRIVDSNLEFVRNSSFPRKPINFFNTTIQTCAAGHTYVFNRKLLEKIPDIIDEKKIYGHDSLITNVAAIYGKIVFDDIPHASYRQHNNNQLGTSSRNIIQWSKSRLKRIEKGDSKKYAEQIYHIYEVFQNDLSKEQVDEMKKFFGAQNSTIKRMKYACTTKIYRQGVIENLAFKMLYLCGGYNIREVLMILTKKNI